MTGDVLPCFDASTMVLPDDASCIITVPISIDIASNHGVIVASKTGILNKNHCVSLVESLLQKPTMEELVKNQAILDDGRTLLDTGIIAVRGKAWLELVRLSCSSEPMIANLLKSKKEVCKFLSKMVLKRSYVIVSDLFHIFVSASSSSACRMCTFSDMYCICTKNNQENLCS